jgi:hypothetical protein
VLAGERTRTEVDDLSAMAEVLAARQARLANGSRLAVVTGSGGQTDRLAMMSRHSAAMAWTAIRCTTQKRRSSLCRDGRGRSGARDASARLSDPTRGVLRIPKRGKGAYHVLTRPTRGSDSKGTKAGHQLANAPAVCNCAAAHSLSYHPERGVTSSAARPRSCCGAI